MTRPALPVMASFCATFLKREMLHVYRQISGIDQFENWVLTRRWINADAFPYPRVQVLRRSPWRFLSRAWHRFHHRRVPLSGYEMRQMIQFGREREVKLIHVYFGSEAARALTYLCLETRPKIVSFHGADVSEDVTTRELQAVCDAADLVLCRSQARAEVLVRRGCPASKIRLNRTGVPFAPKLPGRLPPAPGDSRPLRCLQACRFIPKKGLQISLKAVALLRNRGWPVELTLAGDGPERQALEALTRRLDLQPFVTFAGFLTSGRLLALMSEHDLFLHPSLATSTGDQEGIPNSLLEAMGHGLPVVATRHGGIPEAIDDGIHGILAQAADERMVAEAVERLLTEAHLYERVRENAYLRVKHDYSRESCLEALQQHYHEAVALGQRRVQAGSTV